MPQGAAWADDLANVLKSMMHPAAANDTKSNESAEMKEMRDKMVQVARGDNSGGTALQEWFHIVARNIRREDDEESIRSVATTASKASTIHSSGERNASTREIQEAKAKGATSLACVSTEIPRTWMLPKTRSAVGHGISPRPRYSGVWRPVSRK